MSETTLEDSFEKVSISEKDGDKSENKSTEKSAEKEKTLSESAAEYCENRNKKVEFGEVELITGEEEETNAFQMSAKVLIIYFFANLDLFSQAT